MNCTRRGLLQWGGLGALIGASQLAGCYSLSSSRRRRGGALQVPDDFTFLQLSDTHVGYQGAANPEAAHTLERAVAQILASKVQPDFIVVTGDLTHTTDDDAERRERLAHWKDLVAPLTQHAMFVLPGEHDASLDGGAAFREAFGPTRWSFDRGGIHFVGIDNVSDPEGRIGEEGLAWLRADLEPLDPDAPVVVFAHRPLFDLYPQWDWATRDGALALDILAAHRHVTVFYGHIHQEHHAGTGVITHHAAPSLIFPLPAPGSVPEKKPVPWDAEHPFRGLGWRRVGGRAADGELRRTEIPLRDAAVVSPRTIEITAQKFRFEPSVVEVGVGEPVELVLRSRDRRHGFAVPDLGIRATIEPNEVTRVPLTVDRAGAFPFHCSVFCGSGHEDMKGRLVAH